MNFLFSYLHGYGRLSPLVGVGLWGLLAATEVETDIRLVPSSLTD